jgi:hypothetical protein
MCKKLLITALAVVVGLAVLNGTKLGSLLRYKFQKAGEALQDQIPPETEIGRLRMELDQLAREDERYYDQVARQVQEVKKLRDRVTTDRTALAKREGEIRGMREALANEEATFVSFNGERYPRKDVETQLRLDARKFLADEKAVKADEEHLQLLEETLAINKTKLNDLVVRRKEMAARLQTMEKELAKERLQAQSQMNVDGGAYGKLNKEIDALESRFEINKTKRELRGDSSQGPIRAAEEKKAEEAKLDKEINDRFAPVSPLKKVVGK